MDNASRYYDEIKNYEDVKELIGKREEIFIEFKQTASGTGRMTNDDKVNFSKAASGFAHQQGGVLFWGISTKKDNNDVNRAAKLKPIVRVGAFCSALHSFIKDATDPPVDNIQHRIIYEHDNEESDTGVVVSFFPRSYRVHRCLFGKTRNAFYKRYGDGFCELPTHEIKALFFRDLSPDMELNAFLINPIGLSYSETKGAGAAFWIGFSLVNNGSGLGKNCSIYIWLQGEQEFGWNTMTWLDAEGLRVYKTAQLLTICDTNTGKTQTNAIHIKMNPGIVICPGEKMGVAIAGCRCQVGGKSV